MEGHITVYGEIIPWQEDDAGKYGGVNLKDISNQINAQSEADTLIVHIHSPGGDVSEGFAIHDLLLASGKKIITQIEGLCASMATVIALAGTERRMAENSEFMIHNPWMFTGGTADEIKKDADLLKGLEDKVLDFYVEKTGSARDDLQAMMKEETWLTFAQAKELGFVNEEINILKAVAKINKNHTEMATTEQLAELQKNQKKQAKFIKMMKKKLFGPKMLTVTLGDGSMLDFGDQIQEESEIAVGLTATIDGSPAEGDQVLKDGQTLVFAAGKIESITPSDNDDMQAQLDAKDAEIAELKGAQAKMKKKAKKRDDALAEILKEQKTLKAEMKSSMEAAGIETKETKENKGEGKPMRHLTKKKD